MSTPPTPSPVPDTRSTDLTSDDTLARLAAVIESRRGGDPDKSYVARLFHKGTDAILNEVWYEVTTASATTTPVINLNSYTSADGTTGQTGGSVTFPAASIVK